MPITEGYAQFPPCQYVHITDKGQKALPALNAELNDLPWLKTTVEGVGDNQTVKNEVLQKGLKAEEYSGSVLVSGNNPENKSSMATLVVNLPPSLFQPLPRPPCPKNSRMVRSLESTEASV